MDKPGRARRFLGLSSLCTVVAAILFLGAVVLWGVMRYRSASLNDRDLLLLAAAVALGALAAGLALALALTALIRRQQRKGFAVAGAVLSMAVLLACVATVFAYHYRFSAILHTVSFDDASRLDRVQEPAANGGEVLRTEPVFEHVATAEELAALDPEDTLHYTLYTRSQLPAEIQTCLAEASPSGPSYLLGAYSDIRTWLFLTQDASGQAQTLALLSLDPIHETVRLISLPSELWLTSAQYGVGARLSEISFWGGGSLVAETLRGNYALPIQGYIAVQEDALETFFNAFGTLELVLSEEEAQAMTRSGLAASAGRNHFSGGTAVRYVTSGTDETRDARLKKLLCALLLRLRRLPESQYAALSETLGAQCSTSLSAQELLELCTALSQGDYSVQALSLSQQVSGWTGLLGDDPPKSYCFLPSGAASDWLFRTIYEDNYLSGYATSQPSDPTPQPEE